MNKFVGKFLCLFAIMNLIIFPAFAGERVPAGTVIEEESFVFTVEEAQKMQQYISELEQTIKQRDELLVLKDELIDTQEKKTFQLEESIVLRDTQIYKYQEWQAIDLERVRQLEKQRRADKREKWGALALGIGLTVGSILVADQIDDFAENN